MLASGCPAEGPWVQRAHRNDTEKSVCGRLKTFFFLGGGITSKSGQNCGIFPVCFGVHKTGNA